MTGHEDDFLVRVRAQVMTRDESTEGWLPMSGGGLAHVSIRKRSKLPPDAANGHEYIIYGQRISDQTVILSCVINRDLQYFKVMPTFHHWRAGKQRNGLTFQTAADARAFDKAILMAYDDLATDGECGAQSGEEKTTISWDKYDSLVGEDDVFMTLDLPCDNNSESRCGSEGSQGSRKSDKQKPPLNVSYISPPQPATNSTGSVPDTAAPAVTSSTRSSTPLASSPTSLSRRYSPPSGTISSSSPSPPLQQEHLHHHHHQYQQQRHHSHQASVIMHPQQQQSSSPPPPPSTGNIATISSSAHPPSSLVPVNNATEDSVGGQIAPGDNYSYVQLTTVHDDPPLIRATRRDSNSSLKKHPALTTIGGMGGGIGSGLVGIGTDSPCGGLGTVMKTRRRCRFCQEFYTEEWNTRGACEYAPDCFRSMIDRIPGLQCARGLVYHCMSDSEGDTVAHPCDCSSVDGACTKRWFGLALLSLLVPCLWCYPPLKACHVVGVSCGLCGNRHRPYV